MTRENITRANLLAVLSILALVAFVGGVNWLQTRATQHARTLARHADDVIHTVQQLGLTIRDVETGQRGYLLTGDPDYLKPYERARDQVPVLEGRLHQLSVDEPERDAQLRVLSVALERKLEELGQTVRMQRDGMGDAALRLVRSNLGRDLMVQIEQTLDDIQSAEQVLLIKRVGAVDATSARVRWTSMGGALVALLAMLMAGHMLNRAWRRSSRAELAQRSLAMQLRASLDSLSQGVAVFGPDRGLRRWNQCFHELLDLPPALLREDMPYAAFAELTAERDMALESEAMVADLPAGPQGAVIYHRERPSTRDEPGRQLEMRRTMMADGGFVLTIADMTKRAQAEAVLREAQKMQAIGQLTGGIAHDFNNLLTVILGNLELVGAKVAGDEKLGQRIERAVWAAQRGASLTAHLLAFARKQPLAPAAVDLSAGLATLMPLLQRTLGAPIDIRVVEAAGLWLALADAAQLDNAVLNLALNARDAMPGGGRLTIEAANKVLDDTYARSHSEVRAGDYVMLAVSDTGHGMTPEVLARVFEPFFTTKADGRGNGLGLAMVFGFVKQSGGHIKIYSEPGEGTSVKLYLPRAVAAGAAQPRSVTAVDVPRGTGTILVVEDEPDVREIAVAILRDLGYRVLQASDGQEGLRLFGSHATVIDLLLTDVVLPGDLRGRDLAAQITAARPEIKVLYMSGYTENSIVHHGRLDEGVHLLGKPFKREQLGRKVAEVLGKAAEVTSPGANIVGLRTRSTPSP